MIFDELALRCLIEDVVRNVLREQPRRGSMASDEYVSVAEAARRVDVTPATIREWIGQEKLARYHAGRELRVKVAELNAMLARSSGKEARSPEDEARLFLERRGARRSLRG